MIARPSKKTVQMILKIIFLPLTLVVCVVMVALQIYTLLFTAARWIVLMILAAPFLLAQKLTPGAAPSTANRTQYVCKWLTGSDGSKSLLDIYSGEKFARLTVDASTPIRILPQSLGFWHLVVENLEDGNTIWRRGENITRSELESLLVHALEFIGSESGTPGAVIWNDVKGWKAWEAVWIQVGGSPENMVKMSRLEWERSGMETAANKVPFGEPLMRKVAARLRASGESGGLQYAHRDYCGHGLFYSQGKFILATVSDASMDRTLKSWDSEDDFVSFFAPLDDYACSGADPSNRVFRTEDAWELGNQRLTRDRLVEFGDAP